MPVNFGGPGVTPSLGSLTTTTLTLASGQVWPVPSGRWALKPGPYTSFQEYDPLCGIYRQIGAGPTDAMVESSFSDGANYRLANQTGSPVAAVVTTAGSGYSSATPPTFTASAGGSVWRAVVGGAVATSVTVSAGGTGYVYPPIVLVQAPPPGGIPAGAHCALTNGAVSSVTIDNQGAGYVTPPIITFQNDPREGQNGVATGSGAAAVTTLTGAGTVTALLCLDHGQGSQSAVPTLTVSSGSAAATAVMCWSISAYTVSSTTAGSGYTASVIISGFDTPPGSSVLTNPAIQTQLVKTRNAFIVAALSTGAITATGQVVKDGGVYTAAPTMYVASAGVSGASPVQSVISATMGGQTDTSIIFPT